MDSSSKLHSSCNGIIHSWCGETNYTVPVCAKTLRAIDTKNQIRLSELRSSPLTKPRFCDSNSSVVTDNQNRLHAQNTSLWKIKSVKVRSGPHGTFCCCYVVCRIVVIKMPRQDIDNTRPTQSAWLSFDHGMKTHVSNLVRSTNFEFRRISSIRHHLFTYICHKHSCLCLRSFMPNWLLQFSPGYLSSLSLKLQTVEKNVARFGLRVRKTDHISLHLASLHWLPTDWRIQYILDSVCYNCLNSTDHVYLTERLKIF